jgi:hypothetical protein
VHIQITAQEATSPSPFTLSWSHPVVDIHANWRTSSDHNKGLLAGLVAALLHPDVSNLHIDQPYLEALSLKCEAVYQGRDTSPIGLFLRTGIP